MARSVYSSAMAHSVCDSAHSVRRRPLGLRHHLLTQRTSSTTMEPISIIFVFAALLLGVLAASDTSDDPSNWWWLYARVPSLTYFSNSFCIGGPSTLGPIWNPGGGASPYCIPLGGGSIKAECANDCGSMTSSLYSSNDCSGNGSPWISQVDACNSIGSGTAGQSGRVSCHYKLYFGTWMIVIAIFLVFICLVCACFPKQCLVQPNEQEERQPLLAKKKTLVKSQPTETIEEPSDTLVSAAFCSSCGIKLAASVKFCSKCGTKCGTARVEASVA